jgi:hypothetical protein
MESTTRFLRFWIAGTTLCLLGLTTGCTTDDADPGEDAGGSGGAASGSGGTGGSTSGTGGSSKGGSSTGGSSTGGTSGGATKCANPLTLASTASAIADFDNYDGSSDLATWNFPLGGDTSSGILAGTFGYGDDHLVGSQQAPESFAMIDGHDSTYALSVSDTLAEDYGGGMGLWLSACLDASAFTGISFWVRGNGPDMGHATMSLLMEETTSSTPSSATDAVGTCNGIDDGDTPTCKPPKATFDVTADWTEVRLPWSAFTGAASPGQTVHVDGHNVWQLQYDIGLHWEDDGTGTYAPTAAPYELVVDDLNFY